MSENKKRVEKYIDGFNKLDHSQILSCLTEDVEWLIPGFAYRKGKEEFDQEIENDAFEGAPVITLSRLTEENNVVIAEGIVQTRKKGEKEMTPLLFCDVFEMENSRIKKLTSFIGPLTK